MIIFRTGADEHVISVERLADSGEDEVEDAGPEGEAPETPPPAEG